MTITKNRNLLVFIGDGEEKGYTLDINTGIILGKRGVAVKRMPFSRYDIEGALRGEGTMVCYVLSRIFHREMALSSDKAQKWLNLADRLTSLGVPADSDFFDYFDLVDKEFKAFTKYWNGLTEEEKHGCSVFVNFKYVPKYQALTKRLGSAVEGLTLEMFQKAMQYDLADEDWSVLIYYLTKCKLGEYHGISTATEKVVNYIRWCKAMEKKVDKVPCFSREYVETKNAYEAYKTEYDAKRLTQNYARKAKAFNFTFGEYSVFVPTCPQDIIREGNEMHHCVGSYTDRVINNLTYIVFVRKTATPDQCYITAQVHTDGTLGQYYLAHDRHIYLDADRAFYEAFANHLRENWGE